MQPTLMLQPDGSSLCGQTCVAMAAGVSLDRAVEAVGHSKFRGTSTAEIVRGLRALGVPCAEKLKRMARVKPVLPKRGIVAIHRPNGTKRPERWHWMLTWDGTVFDPGGRWPEGYQGWRITSYLEIAS